MSNAWRLLAMGFVTAALAACSSWPGSEPKTPLAAGPTECQIVYDAGSSGTRLFIYEKTAVGWTEHAGPKTSALADPVRQIRGRTHADVDAVAQEVVAQLDVMRQAGPLDSKGKPAWKAMDWTARCRISQAMVLATAGMRVAEQENREQSRLLWQSVKAKLATRLGPFVQVTARTLTGFEEGLYAWLAVRDGRAGDTRFGIVEMGGASAQVAFPCPGCEPGDDAVRVLRLDGRALTFYSYSFLGLGQDEAPKVLGVPPACAYGVKLALPGWARADCAGRIDLQAASGAGLVDPYNHAGPKKGTSRSIPTGRADVSQWLLTGAFNYHDADAVDRCCGSRGACFNEATSCHRAVYLDKFLDTLNVPVASQRADASWTLGAVLCAQSGCLKEAPPPVCRWSAQGCL